MTPVLLQGGPCRPDADPHRGAVEADGRPPDAHLGARHCQRRRQQGPHASLHLRAFAQHETLQGGSAPPAAVHLRAVPDGRRHAQLHRVAALQGAGHSRRHDGRRRRVPVLVPAADHAAADAQEPVPQGHPEDVSHRQSAAGVGHATGAALAPDVPVQEAHVLPRREDVVAALRRHVAASSVAPGIVFYSTRKLDEKRIQQIFYKVKVLREMRAMIVRVNTLTEFYSQMVYPAPQNSMRSFCECCLEIGEEDDTFNVFTRAVIFLQSTAVASRQGRQGRQSLGAPE